ncbi:response regulator transcription factor [Allorhodopirellula solitaria]|uniref:Oxygen regulatory protein NreC n=1 Tax=Allorhodopirellula solitaria TaxID=2527987 RepID=A0A5C5X1N6_9BACT|nr:response regulator transcription factor [Allorhodopirellula solitaria]TWT56063.1 Oxygen regulatory protein NreC [Allorhodopirellula solitaria]
MSETLRKVARIVVVDDHGIVRFGYAQLINQEPAMDVVGMAEGEREGLELIKREHPDLAIVDLSLDEGDGISLIRSIDSRKDGTKVLVISAHDEVLFAHRVLAAGGAGYINKREAPQKLIQGIETILHGGLYFSNALTDGLLRGRMGSPGTKSVEGIDSLSNRELQVFEQIGNGRSTRQIADAMYLSVKTIERHKENIKQKLGIEHAAQLAQHATSWVLGGDL